MKKFLARLHKSKESSAPRTSPEGESDPLSQETVVGPNPVVADAPDEKTKIAAIDPTAAVTPPPLPEASSDIAFPSLPEDDLEASFALEADALSKITFPPPSWPDEPIFEFNYTQQEGPTPPPIEDVATVVSIDPQPEDALPVIETVSAPPKAPPLEVTSDDGVPSTSIVESAIPRVPEPPAAETPASFTAPEIQAPTTSSNELPVNRLRTNDPPQPTATSVDAVSPLGRLDKGILAAAVVVLIASTFLLFSDGFLTREIDLSHLTPVGQFSKSSNEVRRKVDNGLTFHSVQEHDRVFEGDSIFTGDSAEAQVDLDRGGSLVIDPKSLIVVRTRNGGLEIDLQYGSLVGKLKSGKAVVLVNEGKRSEIDATDAELRITRSIDQKTAAIEVLSGEIRIKGEHPGESRTIRENESATIDSDGVTAQPTSSISLIEPRPNTRLWKSGAIPFRWRGSGSGQDPLLLEVARDASFSSKVASAEVKGESFILNIPPGLSGALYWRVRDQRQAEIRSSPRRFVLFPDVAPIPIFPTQDQTFILKATQANKSQIVRLTWNDSAGSKEWKVQIASDSSFNKNLTEKSVNRKSFESGPLTPGEYHWRIQGYHPGRENAPWSEPMRFSVLEREIPVIAPRIETPIATYEIPYETAMRSAAQGKSGAISVADAPAFKWSPVPGAAEYVLEIDTNENFESPKSIKVGAERSFKLDRVRPGTFSWRVKAVAKTGKVSEPSAVGQMVVVLPPPHLGEGPVVAQSFKSEQAALSGKTVADLKWQTMPFAKGYQVEWSRDRDFIESETFNATRNNKRIVVQQHGVYHYRVRATDRNGAPISAYSRPRTFTYKKDFPPKALPLATNNSARTPTAETEKPAGDTKVAGAVPPRPLSTSEPFIGSSSVPAPLLREPRPETSVVAIGKTPVFMNFRWKPTPGAVQYRIEISATEDFSTHIAHGTSREPIFFMERNLPAGRLYWRVRAELKTEMTHWSPPSTFTVSYK